MNPAGKGTKAAAQYALSIEPGQTQVLRLLLTERALSPRQDPLAAFDETFTAREREADEFYAALTPATVGSDAAAVMRQGFAGMLWSRQAYLYDLGVWLEERSANPITGASTYVRNRDWFHMLNTDVISMPDKWEYPWYAAWDLAFHAIVLAIVDPDFALQQLELMLGARYAHPNGQIPAYEWNFSDVNPPVQAWATMFNYRLQRRLLGDRALVSLKRSFHKLLLNFTWWVNRKDRDGRNVFEGGFLGLDNIGVFDRSAPLPTGGHLEQADGTAWMALFSQNMLEMGLELALHDSSYEELATKFYEHFVWIASAMDRIGDGEDMWDEADGFYYDVLRLPDGSAERLKVRSMVGLLPLCAVTVYPEEVLTRLPGFVERVREFNQRHRALPTNINPPGRAGVDGRRMLSVLDERKIRRVLAQMLDPAEFLSDYGIRALSRYHADHPYVFRAGGEEYKVAYAPAESDSGLFGGNSNWRGPIWMPVNVLLIRALLQLYSFYGDDFTIECPTGSGQNMTLFEVARELADRLARIFLRDVDGRRPVYGTTAEVSGRSALAGPDPLLRVLPRGQWRRHRCQPSDRVDRADLGAHLHVRRHDGRGVPARTRDGVRPPGARARGQWRRGAERGVSQAWGSWDRFRRSPPPPRPPTSRPPSLGPQCSTGARCGSPPTTTTTSNTPRRAPASRFRVDLAALSVAPAAQQTSP